MGKTNNSFLNLRKFVAPEFIFGIDARNLAGRYAQNLGARKILVVTDSGIENAGWTQDVTNSLKDEGIEFTIFNNVSPNPRDYEVMEGSEKYLAQNCNMIVAVGGGSVIDCAKGIGIVSTNKKHILSFKGVDMVQYPTPPLICIPTTSGTSADVSQFAIIADSKQKVKIAIISKSVVPDIALIDPTTLLSMDKYLTACTGIDALVHAIEAFVSNASSSVTDLNAIEAIKLINENLEAAVSDQTDIVSRGKIMQASLFAGLAFSNASLGSVHAMSHSLGGYLDLPHGECNALLLPFVIDYNYDYADEKYNKIAQILNLDFTNLPNSQKKKKLVNYIFDFRSKLGITNNLSERGVNISDISILSGNAINDPCNATNPRVPNKSDLEIIYREAL